MDNLSSVYQITAPCPLSGHILCVNKYNINQKEKLLWIKSNATNPLHLEHNHITEKDIPVLVAEHIYSTSLVNYMPVHM